MRSPRLLLRLHRARVPATSTRVTSASWRSRQAACYPPVGSWRDSVNNTHQSHEIRLSTIEDNRLRGIVGFYWEKFVIDDNMNFNYLGIPQCDTAARPARFRRPADRTACPRSARCPAAFASDPSLRTNIPTPRSARTCSAATSSGVLRVGRLRHHPEGADGDRRHAPLPVRRVRARLGVLQRDHQQRADIRRSSERRMHCTHGLCGFRINLNKSEHGLEAARAT